MTRSEVLKMNNNKLNDVVKIQGTNYDRKRKVTKQMAYRMTQMLNAGKSVSVVAEHLGLHQGLSSIILMKTIEDIILTTILEDILALLHQLKIELNTREHFLRIEDQSFLIFNN